MGTRSIVYGRTDSGIKGVYVHFDGYPDARLPTLTRLIMRDGIDRVMTTLLGRPSGWSSLDDEQGRDLIEIYNDGRFESVPGYGIQYTDLEMEDPFRPGETTRQGNTKYSGTGIEDRSIWIEYLYVIEPDGSISWCGNESLPWDELDWHKWELSSTVLYNRFAAGTGPATAEGTP